MSRKIRRDEDGQFAKGQSGNPDGARLRKPRTLLNLDDLYRTHLEVAGEIVATRGGKPVTLYEHCVRSLASSGATNRLGMRDFLDLTKSAAHFVEGQVRRQALKGRSS